METRIAVSYKHKLDDSLIGIAFTQEAVEGFEKVYDVVKLKKTYMEITEDQMKSLFVGSHESIIEPTVIDTYISANSDSQRMEELKLYIPAGIAEYIYDQSETGYILEKVGGWYPLRLFNDEYKDALKKLMYPEMAEYMEGILPDGRHTIPGRVESLDGIKGLHFDQLGIFVKVFKEYLNPTFMMNHGYRI